MLLDVIVLHMDHFILLVFFFVIKKLNIGLSSSHYLMVPTRAKPEVHPIYDDFNNLFRLV